MGDPSIPGNRSLFKSVRELVDKVDGFYDVIGHGGPWHMADNDSTPLTAYQVAELILNAPDYSGTPVRWISCWTGSCKHGFAQDLANLLGVRVRAANGTVAVHKSYKDNIVVIMSMLKNVPDDLLDLPQGWYDFLPWFGE